MRIPGVIDTLTVREPAAITALAADPRLDRVFAPVGPLINRYIAGRIRIDYAFRGARLPATSAKDDPVRDEAHARLAATLAEPAEAAELAEILDWLGQRGDDGAIGPMVQSLLARRFDAGATGSTESWRAARRLKRAVQATPPERLIWALQQGLYGARARLSTLVGGDRAGIHAVGIAVHNIVCGLRRMRALLAEPGATARLTPAAAAARCLPAPPRVLRQATAAGTTAEGSWRAGTIVIFDLETARGRCPTDQTVFMAGTWAACPAGAWVRNLFETLWTEAARRKDGTK
jgi:hypothetical protein